MVTPQFDSSVSQLMSVLPPSLQDEIRKSLLTTLVRMIAAHQDSERQLAELDDFDSETHGSW